MRTILDHMLTNADVRRMFGVTNMAIWQWRRTAADGGLDMPCYAVANLGKSAVLFDYLEIKEWAREHNKKVVDDPIFWKPGLRTWLQSWGYSVPRYAATV